ncbi:MAG: restriction endonuclease subunit S [Smithella sp.]
MAGKDKKPEIRFTGFTDAWEQRKLGEIAAFSKGQGYSKSDLTEIGTPIILYGRLYTKYQTVISEVDTFAVDKPSSVYSSGNEVIVPASGETAEDIARASVVEKSGVLLGGDLNIVYPNDDVDSAFLALSVSNGEQQKGLAKKAQGKSVVHLHNTDLQEVELSYPSKQEQVEISSLFRGFDNLITIHQRKYDKLVIVKKSMLEKMFPKDGANVPEIRFAGFTDAWEQRKLGEYFEERTQRSSEGELISVTINSGVVKTSDLDRYDNSSDDKSNYKKVEVGDIAYNSMRMWQGASGYSPYSGILSPAYTVVIPNEGVYSLFFAYMFKKPEMKHKFTINSQGLTSDTWNLKFPSFSTIETKAPEYEEQIKIAEFFKSLDNLITLHQCELEKLKNIKKSMLEKMFV